MKRQDYQVIIAEIFQNKNWFWTADKETQAFGSNWYENVDFDVPNRASTTSKKLDADWLMENRFGVLNKYSAEGVVFWKYFKELQESGILKDPKSAHVYTEGVLERLKATLREFGTNFSPNVKDSNGRNLSYPVSAKLMIEEAISINSWLNIYNCEYKGYSMNDSIREKRDYVWGLCNFDLTDQEPTNEGFLANVLQYYLTVHSNVIFPSFQDVKVKGITKRMIKPTLVLHTVPQYLWTLMSLMLIDKSETQICNFRRCKNQYFISTHDRQLFCNKRCQRAETTQRSRDRKREAEINKKGGQHA